MAGSGVGSETWLAGPVRNGLSDGGGGIKELHLGSELAWLAGSLCRWLHMGANLLGALAAGALSEAQIEAAIRQEWEDFARMDEGEPPGLMGWEQEFYGRFIQPDHHVLLVGCGSGRDVIPLIESGVTVVGVDIAAGAVERCRRNLERRGLSAHLIASSALAVDLEERFDRVIFSWFCYSYIQGASRRARVLRNAGGHLRPNGQILLSYLLRHPDEEATRWQAFAARLGAQLSRSGWDPELGDEFEVRGPAPKGLIHYAHRFIASEIEAEAQDAGLAVSFHEQRRHGMAALQIR